MDVVVIVGVAIAAITFAVSLFHRKQSRQESEKLHFAHLEAVRAQKARLLQGIDESLRVTGRAYLEAGERLGKLATNGLAGTTEFTLSETSYRAAIACWLDAYEYACQCYLKKEIDLKQFRLKYTNDLRRLYLIKRDESDVIYDVLHENNDKTYIHLIALCSDWFDY